MQSRLPIQQRLHGLDGLAPAMVGDIMARCVRSARRSELPELAEAALRTGMPDAALAVIERFADLGAEAPRLLKRYQIAPAAIRLALEAPADRPLRPLHDAAVEAVLADPQPDLVVELARTLGRDGAAHDVEIGAARALVAAVEDIVGPTGRATDRPHARAQLERAVLKACATWREHRRFGVLVAAAMLAIRPGNEFAAALADPDASFIGGLRGVPESIDTSDVRRFLIRWLGDEPLGAPAIRWLRSALERNAESVLHDGHLLRTPRRRVALRRLDRPDRALPAPSVLPVFSPRSAAAALALVGVVPGSEQTRAAWLEEAATRLASPLARIRAVLLADRRLAFRARDVLSTWSLAGTDQASRLAGLAMLRGRPDALHLDRLCRVPDPLVSGIARSRRAAMRPRSFFDHWARLSGPARLAAALQARAGDAAAFDAELRTRLHEGDRGTRLAILTLIRQMRREAQFEAALIELAGTDDPRVASASVAALSRSRSPIRLPVLRQALGHEDARVRANAIDGLLAVDRALGPDALNVLLEDEANRPRGSAVRAAIERTRDVDPLATMLHDERPLHRIAALWAAKAARATNARRLVAAVAEDDPVPVVRSEAAAAARFLSRPGPTRLERRPTPVRNLDRLAAESLRAGRTVIKAAELSGGAA